MSRSLLRPIGFLAGLGLLVVLLYTTGWYQLLTPDRVREAVAMAGPAGPLVFMLIYALSTVFFLPATPLSLLSGVVFGPVWGSVVVVLGATVGAVGAFLLARYAGGSLTLRLSGTFGERLRSYDAKLKERAFMTILLLRFLPIVPFNGLNIALGLTQVSVGSYTVATFFGIIPGTIVYVYFGSALSTLSVLPIVLGAIAIIVLSWGGRRLARYYQIV